MLLELDVSPNLAKKKSTLFPVLPLMQRFGLTISIQFDIFSWMFVLNILLNIILNILSDIFPQCFPRLYLKVFFSSVPRAGWQLVQQIWSGDSQLVSWFARAPGVRFSYPCTVRTVPVPVPVPVPGLAAVARTCTKSPDQLPRTSHFVYCFTLKHVNRALPLAKKKPKRTSLQPSCKNFCLSTSCVQQGFATCSVKMVSLQLVVKFVR